MRCGAFCVVPKVPSVCTSNNKGGEGASEYRRRGRSTGTLGGAPVILVVPGYLCHIATSLVGHLLIHLRTYAYLHVEYNVSRFKLLQLALNFS